MRAPAAVSIFIAATLGGCMTYVAPRYTTNPARQAAGAQTGKITVATFTGQSDLPLCRGAHTIRPADGTTLPAYVQRALVAELQASGWTVTPAAANTVTGNVVAADFTTRALHTADMSWTISTSLTVNGKNVPVAVTHSFPPRAVFRDDMLCSQIADELVPTVQDLTAAMQVAIAAYITK